MLSISMQSAASRWHPRVLCHIPFALLLCAGLCTNFLFAIGHDHQRIVGIVTLLATAAMTLMSNNALSCGVFTGVCGKLLAAFFALGLCATTMAFAPRFALFEVSIFFLLYVLARAVADDIAHRGPAALPRILQAVAAICALYTLNFVVAYIGSLVLRQPLENNDFTAGFSNVRFFNHTQTATLPLLILLCALTPTSSKLQWLWRAVTTYWWLALFATTGRGTLMGIFAACAIVAVLRGRAAIPYFKKVAFTAMLGLLTYFVLLVAVPTLTGGHAMNAFADAVARTAADPASNRLVLWQRALGLIAQHPLFGVGPMHFAHFGADLHTGAHPHDWLMQIGSEWGLPALACLIAAIALGLRALLRAGASIAKEDTDKQTILTALIVGAFTILVDGLVSGLFVMPQSQLAIALYLGCAMGWYRTVVPAMSSSAQPRRIARLAGPVLIIAAMAGVAGVLPDVPAKWNNQALTPAEEAANTGLHWPRLWEAGYF